MLETEKSKRNLAIKVEAALSETVHQQRSSEFAPAQNNSKVVEVKAHAISSTIVILSVRLYLVLSPLDRKNVALKFCRQLNEFYA